jgi:hypothetical protein
VRALPEFDERGGLSEIVDAKRAASPEHLFEVPRGDGL